MTDAERKKFFEWLREVLKGHDVYIDFTKVDGSLRTMHCTLQEKYLPESATVSESKREPNENVLSVWDLENNGWRSFRLDSVREVRFSFGGTSNEPVV